MNQPRSTVRSSNSTEMYKRTKLACYMSYFTMSSVFCIPPILFVTFHTLYGISYTLLGTLVLINFCTQLLIDLIFTCFSDRFNIERSVRVMPFLTAFGLAVYALIPRCFPNLAYVGLVVGTMIFSVSAGLSEVLLSPLIAAVPSDDPQKDMSLLHSLYAFGVFAMVCLGTLGLKLLGTENWMYLVMFFALLPVIPAYLFMTSPIPPMQGSKPTTSKVRKRWIGILLCMGCIFLGACAENVMTNWISTFMERSLNMDKTVGDVLGVAMFAVLLGLARIGYAKFGKKIFPVLLVGMAGATACYVAAGLSGHIILSFLACVLTGLFTAMLWPGTLIMMEENIVGVGVSAYALMAASGDFGSSLAPQLMGVVVDRVCESDLAVELAARSSLTPEQIGMRAGMLATAVFPLLGTVLVLVAIRYFKRRGK